MSKRKRPKATRRQRRIQGDETPVDTSNEPGMIMPPVSEELDFVLGRLRSRTDDVRRGPSVSVGPDERPPDARSSDKEQTDARKEEDS